jgi:acetoacetyl-CoA synthetase
MTQFMRWVQYRYGLTLSTYGELWSWSIADIDQFWRAIWEFFEVGPALPKGAALAVAKMPGADWFSGQRINFAQQVLLRAPATGPAILHYDEALNERSLSKDELVAQVCQLADALRKGGIGQGDRVVAYMPNVPETMIAMLATASIGAVWSVVSPETGVDGMLARFRQLEPKLLFAVDAYRFRGELIDRRSEISQVVGGLPTLEKVVVLPSGIADTPATLSESSCFWADFIKLGDRFQQITTFDFADLSFAHPLWILFSSGTTGLPKAMVHSHGGIMLEQLKTGSLHLDVRPGDRLFFYTITGWMIWNIQFAPLLAGATTIIYEGHPVQPDIGRLWQVADKGKATIFGGGPSYVSQVMQSGYRPKDHFALSSLRSVVLSGSPASPQCMQWFLDHVKPDLWIQSSCGGTDVCSSFVGGTPIQPVYAGEIQARALGVDAVALDDEGNSVIDEVGELIIRQPMPSMPIYFWNDKKNQRYLDTYFEKYPGYWQQGDFILINARGGVYVEGRSDATLNRHGVRIGTAEIYRALEPIDVVADALIVNVDLPGNRFWMPLFVSLRHGQRLDDSIRFGIAEHLKNTLSPRHVPDVIIQVPGIPYTKTGKRLEVPLRRILSGTPLDSAVGKDAVADFDLLMQVITIARENIPST